MTEYENIQNKIEQINNEIIKQEREKSKIIEEYEIVQKYISLDEQIKDKKIEIERYRKIIPYIKMYDCNHIFVTTKKYLQGTEEKNIYQCICCGFTNNVPDGLKEFRNECFKKTRKNSALLSKDELDYFEIQAIYKEITAKNPSISRKDLIQTLKTKINGRQKVIK